MFFESEKLAFPVSSQKDSLSWGMRIITIQDLEIPYIIREIAKNNFDWKKAVLNYFKKIGEENPQDFIEIVREIVKRRKMFQDSKEDMVLRFMK